MPRRTGRSRRMGLNAEINVVSLIDVILLLLLIFMITAPMMISGVDITLPTADVQPIESPDAIVVTINSEGAIYVDGQPWSMDQLKGAFPAYARGREEVTFRGDTGVDYGVVLEVVAILNGHGVKAFAMAALQDPIRR